MKRKYIIFFMQFFTSICLVSVGFASWTFVSGDSITASGNIVAQDVHSNDNYIKLESTEVFRYCDTGFITGSGTNTAIIDYGTLTYNYEIDLYNLKNDLGDQANIPISFTLSHVAIDSYTIITNYCTLSSLSINDETLTLNTNYTAINENNVYIINIDLVDYISAFNDDENSTDRYIPLVITYTFNRNSDNFQTLIFPCLSNDNFEFIHKVDVELE